MLKNDAQQRQHAIPNCKAPKTPHYSLVQRASGATRYAPLPGSKKAPAEERKQ